MKNLEYYQSSAVVSWCNPDFFLLSSFSDGSHFLQRDGIHTMEATINVLQQNIYYSYGMDALVDRAMDGAGRLKRGKGEIGNKKSNFSSSVCFDCCWMAGHRQGETI